MKKVVLLVALVLGTITMVNAQVKPAQSQVPAAKEVKQTKKVKTTKKVEATKMQAATPKK